MDTKKALAIVVLVAVIVLAVVFALRRNSSSELQEKMQAGQRSVLNQKEDKIDLKTSEIITETVADWSSKYAPDSSGHWKNPKTGEYTMERVLKCASCGAEIPYPDMPTKPTEKGRLGLAKLEQEQERILAEYICPKCGKNAYLSSGGGEK
jgi:rRNA maturation protein Nop10